LPRFFVDKEQITDSLVYITGDDVKHISKVLRLRENEEITVCDMCKNDYLCRIKEISTDRVVASVTSKEVNHAESDIQITLYQGLPKSDKMDYIVQKCVELGVSKIVPVITKRAVSRPSDSEKKVSRWQKIAAEAAKQCGRGIIPEIGTIVELKDVISDIAGNTDFLNIMPYEEEKVGKLRDVLVLSGKTKINIFIGPEGGFDISEVYLCRDNGVCTVTLGPRILRTETAPLAVCAAVMYELGDW